jgi:crossover junction endodeoxyribonuclease RuvC
MVTKLLRIADPPRPPDAADALALAICHVWRGGAPMSTAPISPGGRSRRLVRGGSA